MADQLTFELVSPVKKLIGKTVTMVTVPGSEGDFGVLIGHAPVIATLRPGVIEVYEGEQISDRIFVAGGFAEVTAERCAVLAQEAVPVADLLRTDIDAEIKQLQTALAEAEESDRDVLAQKLVVAQAKLELAA
jgi:F-type H+-transporting ATPase subunit epsilon